MSGAAQFQAAGRDPVVAPALTPTWSSHPLVLAAAPRGPEASAPQNPAQASSEVMACFERPVVPLENDQFSRAKVPPPPAPDLPPSMQQQPVQQPYNLEVPLQNVPVYVTAGERPIAMNGTGDAALRARIEATSVHPDRWQPTDKDIGNLDPRPAIAANERQQQQFNKVREAYERAGGRVPPSDEQARDHLPYLQTVSSQNGYETVTRHDFAVLADKGAGRERQRARAQGLELLAIRSLDYQQGRYVLQMYDTTTREFICLPFNISGVNQNNNESAAKSLEQALPAVVTHAIATRRQQAATPAAGVPQGPAPAPGVPVNPQPQAGYDFQRQLAPGVVCGERPLSVQAPGDQMPLQQLEAQSPGTADLDFSPFIDISRLAQAFAVAKQWNLPLPIPDRPHPYWANQLKQIAQGAIPVLDHNGIAQHTLLIPAAEGVQMHQKAAAQGMMIAGVRPSSERTSDYLLMLYDHATKEYLVQPFTSEARQLRQNLPAVVDYAIACRRPPR